MIESLLPRQTHQFWDTLHVLDVQVYSFNITGGCTEKELCVTLYAIPEWSLQASQVNSEKESTTFFFLLCVPFVSGGPLSRVSIFTRPCL